MAQGSAVAASDHHHGDAGLFQQLQPHAIQGVKALDRFALAVHVKAAVGEDAVDIQECHADVLGFEQQFGGKFLGGLHQITLARIKSLVLMKPQRRF